MRYYKFTQKSTTNTKYVSNYVRGTVVSSTERVYAAGAMVSHTEIVECDEFIKMRQSGILIEVTKGEYDSTRLVSINHIETKEENGAYYVCFECSEDCIQSHYEGGHFKKGKNIFVSANPSDRVLRLLIESSAPLVVANRNNMIVY